MKLYSDITIKRNAKLIKIFIFWFESKRFVSITNNIVLVVSCYRAFVSSFSLLSLSRVNFSSTNQKCLKEQTGSVHSFLSSSFIIPTPDVYLHFAFTSVHIRHYSHFLHLMQLNSDRHNKVCRRQHSPVTGHHTSQTAYTTIAASTAHTPSLSVKYKTPIT